MVNGQKDFPLATFPVSSLQIHTVFNMDVTALASASLLEGHWLLAHSHADF